MPHREHKTLTDLERRTYRHMVATHQVKHSGKEIDGPYLASMARAAVEALTTGSASGRRVRNHENRVPDPGATPERIRYLARQIEATYHSMPKGWTSADDQLGTTYE